MDPRDVTLETDVFGIVSYFLVRADLFFQQYFDQLFNMSFHVNKAFWYSFIAFLIKCFH